MTSKAFEKVIVIDGMKETKGEGHIDPGRRGEAGRKKGHRKRSSGLVRVFGTRRG